MSDTSGLLPPSAVIVALGERLRESPEPSADDLRGLEELLLVYDVALSEVAERLRSIGLEPTTRLKTSDTIIEKLRRERHLTLRSIRDLAGARLVRAMTLDEQDRVATDVQSLWPDSRMIDRRASPSHGYRAVHVVARVRNCPVEIQIRTVYQDGWAQVMETLGDVWGRAIRYGGEPDEPDEPEAIEPGLSIPRREVVNRWIGLGSTLHALAEMENDVARLRAVPQTPDLERRLAEVEAQIEAGLGPLRKAVTGVSATWQQER